MPPPLVWRHPCAVAPFCGCGCCQSERYYGCRHGCSGCVRGRGGNASKIAGVDSLVADVVAVDVIMVERMHLFMRACIISGG